MENGLTFRPLDVDEHRAFLTEAHRETSRLTFGEAFTDEQIAVQIERERGKSTGAFLCDLVVGICDVETRERDGASYGWVHFFYLSPHMRGKGCGAQLIARAEQYCKERGLGRLCLRVGQTNKGARSFYERGGFDRAPWLDKPGEYGYAKIISP